MHFHILMSNMKLITLFLLFVTPTSSNDDDCAAIASELKQNPLYDDFHEEELLSFCNKKKEWETLKIMPLKNHTINQATFLKKIWECRSVDCFSQVLGTLISNTTNLTLFHRRRRSDTSPPIQVIRKEYRTLTDDERGKFHDAMIQLKTQQIDGTPKYDLIVDYHLSSMAPEAHFTCAFLLYHRELLKQLEVALRYQVPDVAIPYWDSTLEYGLPSSCDSIIFSAFFLGNPKGDVTEGFCSNWTPTGNTTNCPNNLLCRQCGQNKYGRVLKQSDIDKINVLATTQDILCTCGKNYSYLELAHGTVHNLVGGHMLNVGLSPNDPSFFMHHCFMDYLWEQWRLTKQDRNGRETDYPNNAVGCDSISSDDAQAPMQPFNSVNIIFGLNNSYTDNLYTYATRPSCPSNCPGPYLFCGNANKCMSKIRLGGNCTGLATYNCCYNGTCVNNMCQ